MFEEFFIDLDKRWDGAHVELHVIGSAALMMQHAYQRGTRDGDVLETITLTNEAKEGLRRLAGPKTPLSTRHGIYIDIVANGLPFLPREPSWHHVNGLTLRRLGVRTLDVTDVIVSKLKRFNANDQADADAMIGLRLVEHAQLLERFRSAFDEFRYDARAAELPRYVANLHRVERDMFRVPETEIDVPDPRY